MTKDGHKQETKTSMMKTKDQLNSTMGTCRKEERRGGLRDIIRNEKTKETEEIRASQAFESLFSNNRLNINYLSDPLVRKGPENKKGVLGRMLSGSDSYQYLTSKVESTLINDLFPSSSQACLLI